VEDNIKLYLGDIYLLESGEPKLLRSGGLVGFY